jgi:hypothetical protein
MARPAPGGKGYFANPVGFRPWRAWREWRDWQLATTAAIVDFADSDGLVIGRRVGAIEFPDARDRESRGAGVVHVDNGGRLPLRGRLRGAGRPAS